MKGPVLESGPGRKDQIGHGNFFEMMFYIMHIDIPQVSRFFRETVFPTILVSGSMSNKFQDRFLSGTDGTAHGVPRDPAGTALPAGGGSP